MSQVDGRLTEPDLAALMGISEGALRATLDKLASLGFVTIETTPDPTAPRPPSDASEVAAYDPAELDEPVDLDMAQRKRILDLFYRLESLTHYEVLGVPPTSDKKAIKRSYFDHAASFHPDKFFRKKLGAYKLKMETIFGRLTQAHDVLTQKATRAEYDQYLGDQARTRGIESMLKDVLSEMAAAERAVKQEVPDALPLELGASAGVAPSPAPRPATPAPTTTGTPIPPRRTGSIPPAEQRARRDVLARRLLGGRAPTPRSPAAHAIPAQTALHASANDAVEALRRRYEERVQRARGFQSKRYAEQAATAMAQNDPIAASNAYKVALTMAPDDPEILAAHDRAQLAANAILGETYTRQAGYEEKAGNFAEAAKSWKRVAQARPNEALAHERAANALVRAGGDLHEAARLGLRACALEATNAKFRLTLGNVYLAAGMNLNAKRELEVAAQLSPQDDTIVALLKRIAKET